MKHLACIPINGRTIGRDGSNYGLGAGPRMNNIWGIFFVFFWSPRRQRSSPKTLKWALVNSVFAKGDFHLISHFGSSRFAGIINFSLSQSSQEFPISSSLSFWHQARPPRQTISISGVREASLKAAAAAGGDAYIVLFILSFLQRQLPWHEFSLSSSSPSSFS